MRKPVGYWTKEKCYEEALKCKSRGEFSEKYHYAYTTSRKKGWLEEVCSHMELIGDLYKRLIYVYEFSNNYVYIGLTCNVNSRQLSHNVCGPVYEHAKKYGLKPTFIKIIDYYIDVNEAVILEEQTLQKYKKEGWIPLNSAKTGGLGGNITKWSKEKCLEIALCYLTRKEFKIKSIGSYKSALKNGWLDECCKHMNQISKPVGYWTKEMCAKDALNYKTKAEYKLKSGSSYFKALKNDWIKEICSHMIEIKKPNGYWAKEKCKEQALKYKTKTEFYKKARVAYSVASSNKWLDEICSHMK